jgi:hypothetical protein
LEDSAPEREGRAERNNEADIATQRAFSARGVLWTESAEAHGIAGNRYFDGTVTFDDPAVADEGDPATALLDHSLSKLFAQIAMHDRARAADYAMGT